MSSVFGLNFAIINMVVHVNIWARKKDCANYMILNISIWI